MAYTSGEGTPSIFWSLCDHIPANLSLSHLSSIRPHPDPESDLPTAPYWSRPCPFPPDLFRLSGQFPLKFTLWLPMVPLEL